MSQTHRRAPGKPSPETGKMVGARGWKKGRREELLFKGAMALRCPP